MPACYRAVVACRYLMGISGHVVEVQASVVGDSCSGAVGSGDVVLISAGPGNCATVTTVAAEARRAGEKPTSLRNVAVL